MTFGELKKRMARRTGKNASTLDPLTDARFMDYLNEAHAQLLRAPGRESLRYASIPFRSVVGQPLYSLPTEATRVNRVMETVNDRRLEYRTPDWLDTVSPDPQRGTPWVYIPRGYSYVHKQPTASSLLYVRGRHPGDLTQVATVEGTYLDGRRLIQTAVLNGELPVPVGIHPVVDVSRFFLSATTTLLVHLSTDPDVLDPAQELGLIPEGRLRQQYQVVQLYPTPTAVIEYQADVLMQVPTLTADSEEPILPPDFHEILIPMALLREFTKADDPSRWEQARQEAKQGWMALDTFLTAHPDWNVKWGGPEVQGSRLGAWFPAGS